MAGETQRSGRHSGESYTHGQEIARVSSGCGARGQVAAKKPRPELWPPAAARKLHPREPWPGRIQWCWAGALAGAAV